MRQICLISLKFFRGASPPIPPTRGSAPWPHWGLRPQTPAIEGGFAPQPPTRGSATGPRRGLRPLAPLGWRRDVAPVDGCRGARSEGLRATLAGHRKQNYPTFFNNSHIQKKIPTFSWPFPHSHNFLKNLAGHPEFIINDTNLLIPLKEGLFAKFINSTFNYLRPLFIID